MNKAPCLLLACSVAIALGQTILHSAPGRVTSVVNCNLIGVPFERFPGETTSKDFFIQLPEHIRIQPGSELNLMLQHSPRFEASGIMLAVNGRRILTTNFDLAIRSGATNIVLPLRATVPPESLAAGWNRISLEWSLPQAASREVLRSAAWSIWRFDSHLKVVYQRVPLFTELARFPASLAEEKLLRPEDSASDASSAVMAILVPPQRRDVHLRSAAIFGARLGQLGYLSDGDCLVGLVADQPRHASERNGIVVGRWDEVSALSMATNLAADVTALREGDGLIAEFILGNDPDQRRWMFATGRDDAGVEKAVLTLGSVHALASIPPSPALVHTEPELSEKLEAQKNGPRRIALRGILSGDSTLETAPAPVRITGLHQVHQFLVRDSFLRKAAFLVPRNLSLQELQSLLNLSLELGRQLPSSPVLWPEACGYSNDAPATSKRLQGRSVLLLAPVPQWNAALPARTRLAIGPPDGDADIIRIQGRRYKFSSFEPSLIFMQMLASPWSSEETLVTVGGWKDFASPTVKRMVMEAAPGGRLYGNLAAMDATGRTVTYDTRRPSVESFAERIQRRMPVGLGREETERKLRQEEKRARESALWNDLVFYFVGALLLFFVALRLLLLWERERSRKKSTRGDKQVGSTP
jgi:Bacterial cellulose synthase subunit